MVHMSSVGTLLLSGAGAGTGAGTGGGVGGGVGGGGGGVLDDPAVLHS